MTVGSLCPHPGCGRTTDFTPGPTPTPDCNGRLDCPEHGFVGWAEAPMTIERARSFTLPFGKHAGRTLQGIETLEPSYVNWLASYCRQRSLKRAAQCVLDHRKAASADLGAE